jgi:hypothetical protein
VKQLTRVEASAYFSETEGTFEVVEAADDCRKWVYNPRYPVRKFVGRILGRTREETRQSWLDWLEGERDDRPDYINELESAWLKNPKGVGPVIIAELPDGSLDVGDGWHRIAIAVSHNMKTIPAIVGLNCRVDQEE